MKLVQIGPVLAALLVASCAANSRQVTAQRAAAHAEEEKQEAREEAQAARREADKARLQALEATREQREAEQNARQASQRAAQAEAQAAQPVPATPLPGTTERQPEYANPAAVTKHSVFFAANGAELTSDDKVKLDDVARSLRESTRAYNVSVDGYSDDSGTESENLQLSRRRADAVANYLSSKGIRSERITTKAMGSRNLANNEGTAAGRALNRRVEVVIQLGK